MNKFIPKKIKTTITFKKLKKLKFFNKNIDKKTVNKKKQKRNNKA